MEMKATGHDDTTTAAAAAPAGVQHKAKRNSNSNSSGSDSAPEVEFVRSCPSFHLVPVDDDDGQARMLMPRMG